MQKFVKIFVCLIFNHGVTAQIRIWTKLGTDIVLDLIGYFISGCHASEVAVEASMYYILNIFKTSFI